MLELQTIEDETLLTPDEVSRVLRVPRRNFLKLARRNKIATVRVGRGVRVRPSALREYLNKNTSPVATA